MHPVAAYKGVDLGNPCSQHFGPHLQVGRTLFLRDAEDGSVVAVWKVAVIYARGHSDEPATTIKGKTLCWDVAAPYYGSELVLRAEGLHLLGRGLPLAANLPRHQRQRGEEFQQHLLVEPVQGLHRPGLHRVREHQRLLVPPQLVQARERGGQSAGAEDEDLAAHNRGQRHVLEGLVEKLVNLRAINKSQAPLALLPQTKVVVEVPVLVVAPQERHPVGVGNLEAQEEGQDLEAVSAAVAVVSGEDVSGVEDVPHVLHRRLVPSEVREQVQQLAVQGAKDLDRRLQARDHHILQLQQPYRRGAQRPQVCECHQRERRFAAVWGHVGHQALKVGGAGGAENLTCNGPGVCGGRGQLLLLPDRGRRRRGRQREVGWRSRPVRCNAVSRAWLQLGTRAEVLVQLQQVRVPVAVLAVRGRVLLHSLVAGVGGRHAGATLRGHGAALGGGGAALGGRCTPVGAAAARGSRGTTTAARLDDRLVEAEQARGAPEALVLDEFVKLLEFDCNEVGESSRP
mmetsp:Transcript_38315/g.110689  ORF Transcript_38315/g.110689 Transcript_38315/m.110689 type:complete len:512 (-) Transcript_38315:659-2194(-)